MQVLTVLVLFLGECELNTRRKHAIPLPASWSIILGSRAETCDQKLAFNTPLRQEGYFIGKNSAAKFGKIKIISVFCNDAQKATHRSPQERDANALSREPHPTLQYIGTDPRSKTHVGSSE